MKLAISFVRSKGEVALDLESPDERTAFEREEWLGPTGSKSVTKIAGSRKTCIILVLNGMDSWRTVDERFAPFSNAEAGNLRADLNYRKVCSLYPLMDDPKYRLSYLNEAKIEGRLCHAVRVDLEGERTVTLYFDRDTFLLRAAEEQVFEGEKPFTRREVWLNYRDYENVKTPAETSDYIDGKKVTHSVVQERKFLERLPDDIFKKP